MHTRNLTLCQWKVISWSPSTGEFRSSRHLTSCGIFWKFSPKIKTTAAYLNASSRAARNKWTTPSAISSYLAASLRSWALAVWRNHWLKVTTHYQNQKSQHSGLGCQGCALLPWHQKKSWLFSYYCLRKFCLNVDQPLRRDLLLCHNQTSLLRRLQFVLHKQQGRLDLNKNLSKNIIYSNDHFFENKYACLLLTLSGIALFKLCMYASFSLIGSLTLLVFRTWVCR